jgi:hypothetical protein
LERRGQRRINISERQVITDLDQNDRVQVLICLHFFATSASIAFVRPFHFECWSGIFSKKHLKMHLISRQFGHWPIAYRQCKRRLASPLSTIIE